mmetsp:Transcript_37382/g.110361  ORF Transcript_37382/g.110361 Transcript_37382/m.110361 type:complete len:84 (-) Transcript_37382:1818-2069(-)
MRALLGSREVQIAQAVGVALRGAWTSHLLPGWGSRTCCLAGVELQGGSDFMLATRLKIPHILNVWDNSSHLACIPSTAGCACP